MKKLIHVNRHFIAANAKDGKDRPVYTIKTAGTTIYAKEVIIDGPSKLVYNGKTLSCGAKAWIETEAELILTGQTTFKEVKELYNEAELF